MERDDGVGEKVRAANCRVIGALLWFTFLFGACDFLWPTDAPYDPRQCDPRCGAGKVCHEGNCIDAKVDGAVKPPDSMVEPDTKIPDGPSSDVADGAEPDSLLQDIPTPDLPLSDLPLPDQLVPDLTPPDLAIPDLLPPTCTDTLKNGDETDVDCGGKTCPQCADGKSCKLAVDCTSGVCTSGICAAPGCTDNVLNGAETDIDCGGSTCSKCVATKKCNGAGDCASGVCSGGVCQKANCTDKAQNGAETDVDCGGSTCPKCDIKKACKGALDCKSGVCVTGVCSAVSCTDKVKNGDESDVDCGGSNCGGCSTGKKCMAAKDCQNDVCSGGICAVPTCSDWAKNDKETDVDCGGTTCPACADSKQCKQASDCQSAVCSSGKCAAPTCTDKVKNGKETDTDCGGACPGCAVGKQCVSTADCQSKVCSVGKCQVSTCTDKVKNGAETDVDCGGGACAKCTYGKQCKANTDCTSTSCQSGSCHSCGDGIINGIDHCDGTALGGNTCKTKGYHSGTLKCTKTCTQDLSWCGKCNDASKNGTETDVDCGSNCAKCADTKGCAKAADCQSGVCSSGKCAVPSCADKVKNGTETGVDCGGGICSTCADGKKCSTGKDCASGVCKGTVCQAPNCTDSVKNGGESDVDCGGGTCTVCALGNTCGKNSDCVSSYCKGGICATPSCTDSAKNGTETDVDCGGGTCPKCTDSKTCNKATDCLSGICGGYTCQIGCVHQAVVKDCKLDSTLGLTFCTIPSGCYKMGSPKSDKCRGSNEPDQIPVTLTHKFEMQTTEVTQDQFYALMGYKPSLNTCGGTCPVEWVSWHEAAAYCNALSSKKGLPACYTDNASGKSCTKDGDCGTGEICQNQTICIKYDTASTYSSGNAIYTCKGYRLPTEAEWEYAYRAGKTTAYHSGANQQSLCYSCDTTDVNANSIGWYCYNSSYKSHPVGKKTPNTWGLHDMAGNVWEWCHDGYQSNLGGTVFTDPVFGGSDRVLRGGSWMDYPQNMRASYRFNATPTNRGDYQALFLGVFGFRCSRTSP